MKKITKLDLTKFPLIENVSGLLKYDPFKEFPRLINLGDISERIYGCSEFIGGKSDSNYPHFSENANLRAFLNEFASLNEILKNHTKLELKAIAIENTDYPIFHFLKLLRNINFHVKTMTGNTEHYKARLYDRETNECWGKEITLSKYVIVDCDITLIENAWDIKHYENSEIIQTLEWINVKQTEHGINDLLEAALRQYCRLIDANAFSVI